MAEEEPFYEAKNIYELFFSSIPIIIKQQQRDHWEIILSNFKKFEQHQNQEVEIVSLPTTLSGEDVLPGFTLELPIF